MNNFILAQIVSAVALVSTILGVTCKNKTQSMWWLFLANICLLSTYFLLEMFLGAGLIGIAVIRSVVYLFYTQKKLKPSVFVLLIFQASFVVVSALFWTHNIDLLILINLMILTYSTWQTKMQVVRVGYLCSSSLLFFYDILVGAYVGTLSKVFLFTFTLISFIKNNKQKNNTGIPKS